MSARLLPPSEFQEIQRRYTERKWLSGSVHSLLEHIQAQNDALETARARKEKAQGERECWRHSYIEADKECAKLAARLAEAREEWWSLMRGLLYFPEYNNKTLYASRDKMDAALKENDATTMEG